MYTFDFLTLIFTVLANLTLVVLVYFYGRRNINQTIFISLVLFLTFWGVNNYFSVQAATEVTLFWIRVVMFFAVPQTALLFLFIYTFPDHRINFSKWSFYGLLSGVGLFMIGTLTPWVFKTVEFTVTGVMPVPGILMPAVGIFIFANALLAFYFLIKRYRESQDIVKIQWRFIASGLFMTFILMLSLNYLAVVIFDETRFIRFGHLFHLPLILTFTYALIRHRLMSIQVVASQLLTVFLSFFMLVKVLTSSSPIELLINLTIFIAVIAIGVWLVNNVIKEIEQQHKLEEITSELKSANARLKKLDQAKTEFLSITSHQLRTPLSAIKGYLSMLDEGDYGKLTNKQAEIIGVLLRNSERLIRLINIFLNISRIESGRLKINKAPNKINKTISDIIKSLMIEAKQKNIKLDFKPKDLPAIQFDSDKVADVVLNLVDNAIKYTPAGGKVDVKAKVKDKYILVTVKDNGTGIPYDELDSLFEKFKRGSEINKVDTSGVGLGLYIAKKIIQGHGGNIWAESEGYGKGATFKFTLPLG